MRSDRDRATAQLDAWLEEGSTAAPDYVLDAVLDKLSTTPQQRGFLPRLLATATPPVLWGVTAAVVLAVAVLLGGPALDRAPAGVGFGPQATPSPTTDGGLAGIDGPLPAGRYALSPPFPPGITFEVPDGWSACSPDGVEQTICRSISQDDRDLHLSFLIVEDVVEDPCQGTSRDEPVGPGLDDLAEALAALPGFTTSSIRSLTVDGHEARELTITAVSQCSSLRTWITPLRTNGVSAGETNRVRIVDVDGVRVVIASASHPGRGGLSGDEQRALIEDLIESVRIAD